MPSNGPTFATTGEQEVDSGSAGVMDDSQGPILVLLRESAIECPPLSDHVHRGAGPLPIQAHPSLNRNRLTIAKLESSFSVLIDQSGPVSTQSNGLIVRRHVRELRGYWPPHPLLNASIGRYPDGIPAVEIPSANQGFSPIRA